jgi:hypothetical protein
MWPALSYTTELSTDRLTIAADDPRLGGKRFLAVWQVDVLGECCCPAGSRRGGGGADALSGGGAWGITGACRTAGKHPWWVRVDGQDVGFPHGTADAVGLEELLALPGGWGTRRAGVCLGDVVVIDIDSPRALRAWVRLADTVPADMFMGVARTPRGWHVWLDLPGWTQASLNRAMALWLGDWHGTDPGKVGVRGWLLDLRTGPGRYVVWPGPEFGWLSDRGWARPGEYRAAMSWARRGMRRTMWPVQDPDLVLDGHGETYGPGHGPGSIRSVAPWLQARVAAEVGPDAVDELARWQVSYRDSGGYTSDDVRAWADGLVGDIDAVQEAAVAQLDRWCERLAGMGPESGRKNLLNATGFGPGARAAVSGALSLDEVRDRMTQAATACGCPGAAATIRSGLESGVRLLSVATDEASAGVR